MTTLTGIAVEGSACPALQSSELVPTAGAVEYRDTYGIARSNLVPWAHALGVRALIRVVACLRTAGKQRKMGTSGTSRKHGPGSLWAPNTVTPTEPHQGYHGRDE